MLIKIPGRNEYRRFYDNSLTHIALYRPKSKYPAYFLVSGCHIFQKRNMSGEVRIYGRHFRPMKYFRTSHKIPVNLIRSRAIRCRNTISQNGILSRQFMKSWRSLHEFAESKLCLSQAWIEEDDEY